MMFYDKHRGMWVDDYEVEMPMPGTSHDAVGDFTVSPDFKRQAIMTIEWLPLSKHNDFDTVKEVTTFERRRFFGPAPFVGDPLVDTAVYVWDAWVAADGRWIGGPEAHLQWRHHL